MIRTSAESRNLGLNQRAIDVMIHLFCIVLIDMRAKLDHLSTGSQWLMSEMRMRCLAKESLKTPKAVQSVMASVTKTSVQPHELTRTPVEKLEMSVS